MLKYSIWRIFFHWIHTYFNLRNMIFLLIKKIFLTKAKTHLKLITCLIILDHVVWYWNKTIKWKFILRKTVKVKRHPVSEYIDLYCYFLSNFSYFKWNPSFERKRLTCKSFILSIPRLYRMKQIHIFNES